MFVGNNMNDQIQLHVRLPRAPSHTFETHIAELDVEGFWPSRSCGNSGALHPHACHQRVADPRLGEIHGLTMMHQALSLRQAELWIEGETRQESSRKQNEVRLLDYTMSEWERTRRRFYSTCYAEAELLYVRVITLTWCHSTRSLFFSWLPPQRPISASTYRLESWRQVRVISACRRRHHTQLLNLSALDQCSRFNVNLKSFRE